MTVTLLLWPHIRKYSQFFDQYGVTPSYKASHMGIVLPPQLGMVLNYYPYSNWKHLAQINYNCTLGNSTNHSPPEDHLMIRDADMI